MFLVRSGVPFETVFGVGAAARPMSPPRRIAWCVVCGELDGGTWDWGAMRWEERRA